jgi:hypothetical protein
MGEEKVGTLAKDRVKTKARKGDFPGPVRKPACAPRLAATRLSG